MHLLKGMSKKRHTRAPCLAGVKKRHPHTHSPGNLKEVKFYNYFEN
jgi:hypothetical protein